MDENRTYSQESENTQKPKGKKGFYIKVVALALCCAILGGVIGGGVVYAAGNFITVKEMCDIFDDGHFTLRGRFNLWHPFSFSFGNTRDFIKDELLTKPYIGVSAGDSLNPEGALLDSVEKGSPAAKGGLKDGDIITMINNHRIEDSDDLVDYISDSKVGEEIVFTVYRNGETLECTVTVGEQSSFSRH